MSSTKRGGQRQVSDYYVTPVPEIITMLERLFTIEPDAKSAFAQDVLDPAAGGDSTHLMSYPTAIHRKGICPRRLVTVDLRADSPAEYPSTDYLSWTPNFRPTVIITNPPFSHARRFIEKAHHDMSDPGYIIMLLRLNFFGSMKRRNFWCGWPGMPKYTFVHPRRMSFTDDGKTDSIEYMHCVWKCGHYYSTTQLTIL